MTLSMLAGPELEPISVAEAKLYLRVDHDAENDVIAALITTARLHVERVTRRAIMQQTWRLYADDLSKNNMLEIGIGPVREVIQALCYDQDGDPFVIAPEDYIVDVSSVPARIKFHFRSKPDRPRLLNGYEIDFIAGFGSTTLDIPADLRQAVIMLVAHWYENRSAVTNGMSASVTPKGVCDLIQPYRVANL